MNHLSQLVGFLAGERELQALEHVAPPPIDPAADGDLADVRGQPRAKRALAIAATGAHNLLLIGPPGAGKSMLALRLAGILPPMTEAEALAAAEVAAVTPGGFEPRRFGRRPFRSPHHSASAVALIGGGCQLSQLVRHFGNRCDKSQRLVRCLHRVAHSTLGAAASPCSKTTR